MQENLLTPAERLFKVAEHLKEISDSGDCGRMLEGDVIELFAAINDTLASAFPWPCVLNISLHDFNGVVVARNSTACGKEYLAHDGAWVLANDDNPPYCARLEFNPL